MSARIGLQKFERPEVELDGKVYTINVATKSVVAKAEALESRLEGVDDVTAMVALYADLLDLRLSTTETGQHKASTALKRLWDREELSVQQIERLVIDIGETDRPI